MMLDKRYEPERIPSYSLTGDLLSFLRCGLQYRYHNGSSLPPSRPVQLWFGEFIHGVMENAYRVWSLKSAELPFPWPFNPTPFLGNVPEGRADHDIGTIGEIVEETLRAQGKSPRSRETKISAYNRAAAAINDIAPHLFPLIASAEERVIGTRLVPYNNGSSISNVRSDRYELHGVIDVLTDIQLNEVQEGNMIKDAITRVCDQLPPHFEVIVDYKGARRPSKKDPFWEQAEWQVQTYAWLRNRQPNSLPVAAGLLIYINELVPGADDIIELQHELQEGTTDILPDKGSKDDYHLSLWQRGNAIPEFSIEFRISRTLRVIPISDENLRNATKKIDQVVLEIEQCAANEALAGNIRQNWNPGGDEKTCVACDFRHFCPNPAPRLKGKDQRPIQSPAAP
jgi:hypothetical protein